MPKFSIIIPVYNVEKYIKKCLDSVFNQTYKDFEVIVVNDGTPDKSMEMIKEYNVTIIDQKNQGLSAARNNAVKKAKGDYIIFLDSDDYWRKDLLKEINKSLKNNPDVVRFQIQEIFEDQDGILEHKENSNYGYSVDNPILLSSIPEEYSYLSSLKAKGINKMIIGIDRKGSISNGDGLLDLWEITVIDYNSQRKETIKSEKIFLTIIRDS